MDSSLALSFDDVLIKPQFSTIASRKDVNVHSNMWGNSFFPVISANMDTITGPEMAHAMDAFGAIGCLHRFWDIQANIDAFKASPLDTWCSLGLGKNELERAEALYSAGCTQFLVDVAHGASQETVNQTEELRNLFGNNIRLVVGNFAAANSLRDFLNALPSSTLEPDAYKIGIGGGSACTTRIVTGCGVPTLGSLLDCAKLNVPLIADGGMRTSGDIAKALAVPNVKAVMLGGMLAGTNETPAEKIYAVPAGLPNEQYLTEAEMTDSLREPTNYTTKGYPKIFKKYRGSASQESYAVQNKDATWRTPEGRSFLVPYRGSVENVLQQIDAGLRSAFSYVGAHNLKEFQKNAEFIQITINGVKENYAHGEK